MAPTIGTYSLTPNDSQPPNLLMKIASSDIYV